MEVLYKEYDIALKKIQDVCYSYVLGDKKEIDYVELISMEACLLSMKEDLTNLRDGLSLKDQSDHFNDIYQSLSKITLSSSVDSKSSFKTKRVLNSNITLLLRNINMCFGIIKRMIQNV